MSDYISKSALEKYLRDYKWEFALGSDFSKAIEMVDVQPTLDEKEIIRKAFERVVERLENEKERNDISCTYWDKHDCKDSIQYNEYDMSRKKSECFEEAIEIVKEECGINE